MSTPLSDLQQDVASTEADIGITPAPGSAQRKAGSDTTDLKALDYSAYLPPTPKLIAPYHYLGMGAVSGIQESLEWMANILFSGRDAMGNSLQIGSKFYVPSGKCDATTSDAACAGKTRYLYFDTVPSTVQPCEDPSQPRDPNQTVPQGLLAGVADDVLRLNPFELTASMLGDGSLVNNTCVRRNVETGIVAPYGHTSLENTQICTAPEMPLVCGIPQAATKTCTPYPPVPSMAPLNTLMKQLLPHVAHVINPNVTADVYPTVNASPAQLPPLRKNDPMWRALTARVEEGLHTALNIGTGWIAVDPELQLNTLALNIQVHSKGRCLVSKMPCVPGGRFGSGWYFYEWTALHGFVNLPGAALVNNTGSCVNANNETGCCSLNTYEECQAASPAAAMYCAWNSTAGTCEKADICLQICWTAFIQEDTYEVILDPSLFDFGVGNPPGGYADFPASEFASLLTNTGLGTVTAASDASSPTDAAEPFRNSPTAPLSRPTSGRGPLSRWTQWCASRAWVRWAVVGLVVALAALMLAWLVGYGRRKTWGFG